jgi:Transmembrane secretion effector
MCRRCRCGTYVVTFSALLALLPLFARTRVHGSASEYGVLLAALGVGGVAGGFALPRFRKRCAVDSIVVVASIGYGATLAGFATVQSVTVGFVLLAFARPRGHREHVVAEYRGAIRITRLVRGRGLAIYQFTFMLAFAAGAAFWGALGSTLGVPTTLAIAGCCMAATAVLTLRFPLRVAEGVDVHIVEHAEPFVPVTLAPDDGLSSSPWSIGSTRTPVWRAKLCFTASARCDVAKAPCNGVSTRTRTTGRGS